MSRRERAVGIALTGASILALLMSVVTGINARATALCHSAAAAQDRAAMRTLVSSVLNAGESGDEQARIRALRDYLASPIAPDC